MELLLWRLRRRLWSRLRRTLVLRRHARGNRLSPLLLLLINLLHLSLWCCMLRMLGWMLLWMLCILELRRLRLTRLRSHLHTSRRLWVIDGRIGHVGIARLLRLRRLRDLQVLVLGRNQIGRGMPNVRSRAGSRHGMRLWRGTAMVERAIWHWGRC